MSNIYKKIKINWTYPTQPTSLQIGTVKIYRGTSEFTLDNVLSQVELVSQEYDSTFTSFIDDFELEYDTTYYYMIIVYGDTNPEILAATAVYSIKIETPVQTPTISCEGATAYADFAFLVRDGVDPSIIHTDQLQVIVDGEVIPATSPTPNDLEVEEGAPFPYEIPNGFQNATLTPRFYNLSDVNRRVEVKSLSEDIKVFTYNNPTSIQLSDDNSHAGACLSGVVPISCEGSPHRVSFYVDRVGQGGNTTFYLEYKNPNGVVLTEADLNSMGVQVSEYDDPEDGWFTSFRKQGDAFPTVRFIVTLVQVGDREFVLSHDYSGNATVVEEGVSYGVCLATPF